MDKFSRACGEAFRAWSVCVEKNAICDEVHLSVNECLAVAARNTPASNMFKQLEPDQVPNAAWDSILKNNREETNLAFRKGGGTVLASLSFDRKELQHFDRFVATL